MPESKIIDFVEDTSMRWPDGCERTRIKDRTGSGRWQEGWKATRDRLMLELKRLDATKVLISRHESESLDPGVAVWFSRAKPDFSWQQGLGFENPAPSVAEIDAAFRAKATKYHPDNPVTGDPELFKQFSEWRLAAKAWVTGRHNQALEYVMAIDQYKEARLNLKALQLAFYYIRRLEDIGAPGIITQALGAFRAKLTGGSNGSFST